MTLVEKLAQHFKSRPGQWIDAHELLPIAGFAGWRTRISELRKPPYNMDIQNRTGRGAGYTCSFYRYVPAQQQEVA